MRGLRARTLSPSNSQRGKEMNPKYRCLECATIVLKLYETRTAVWKKNVLDGKDEGEIDHYGDRYYTWQCGDHKCSAGLEWSDVKPHEIKEATQHAAISIHMNDKMDRRRHWKNSDNYLRTRHRN